MKYLVLTMIITLAHGFRSPAIKSVSRRRLSWRALASSNNEQVPRNALLKTVAVLPVVLVLTPSSASAITDALQTALSSTSSTQVLIQSTSLIFLSEIGDKTFFIASILAARASRLLAFVGSFGALVLMTILSVIIGQIFHSVPDSFTGGLPLDDYVAVASFFYFGVKSLVDGLSTDEDDEGLEEEFKEAEKELERGQVLDRGKGIGLASQAFALTVAAEIGDRSQIATIALSAAQNPFLVTLGACLGHGFATGIAVLGGGLLSKYLTEKKISIIAGTLFLFFAVTTVVTLF
mmetsp:Transcript_6295/g.8834  ORF Transcript_6295/g.8834 Transcript_6295/m.8834 type:complete len:292 (+) Transcript_6295:33-908(+)|eukprot:CAMPEP_0197322204 /NCGR_PEP_ID=MMETSP0891-20130614/68740_1 /TAXON_ID=44058 ORGANISM="Aureoumbra lagunensis, Strain CCMP1510" /NCGR_SAMPLE_ID=MMETSP0891 /ASSEMBLY_ACC=CAM_ASM_000534 /LENGTH=291 /DNA_ID=CAMNT_0042814483 /DNA_START=21 /DNA_END=899 /DNA_ORIENTATION=-